MQLQTTLLILFIITFFLDIFEILRSLWQDFEFALFGNESKFGLLNRIRQLQPGDLYSVCPDTQALTLPDVV